MKVSYNWLQTYFKEKLPAPEKLADLFTFHSFEVEGVDQKGEDTIIDLKVLPDRAHYALSHRGIAREISFVTGDTIIAEKITPPKIAGLENPSRVLELEVLDDRCRRDTKLVIQNITNKPSPEWFKKTLENLGQRSISFIVDVTNYVMLDTGQPLHAFDLDKLTKKDGKVKIVLKKARKNENISLLGGKTLVLDEDTLIFADAYNNDFPLDIAGIKGGTAAEVTASTKNIIVFAANFLPSYIRKTSTKVGIRTDASKRSENGIPPELTNDALAFVAQLILNESKEATVEGVVDHFEIKPERTIVSVMHNEITDRLGLDIPHDEIEKILTRLDCTFTKTNDTLQITPPYYRQDMVIREDIVEEVGRIYGYEKIPSALPPKIAGDVPINKTFYYAEKIKNILREVGVSEVYLYALTAKGHYEVAYPLASDKSSLRTNLTDGLAKSLDKNAENAPLLALDKIKIFEIGRVFPKEGEHTALTIGVKHTRKFKGQSVNEDIRTIREHLLKELGSSLTTVCTIDDTGGLLILSGKVIGQINAVDGILELNLDKLIEKLPEPTTWDLPYEPLSAVKYRPLSVYPFITRDIAVFVPENVASADLSMLIFEAARSSSTTSAHALSKSPEPILQTMYLFDQFSKTLPDGTVKKSYAFRLIFQSLERTLEDAEINPIMEKVYAAVKEKGFEVR